MNFLIQTINNKIIHDFSRELVEAIEYNNWFYNSNDYIYELTETISLKPSKDICPCGSVEFVIGYMKLNYNIDLKPINIPECLFKYAGRYVFNGTYNDINYCHFIKSNDIIKGISGFVDSLSYEDIIKNKNYQISQRINILSEYRCFVFKNELVGIKHYTGDFELFPDISTIKSMIRDYKDCPIAYTLDVGIDEYKNTIIIECHDFFSCGLYLMIIN